MGGAPRNPAPRNQFLVWIVKPSGCHCTDAFGGEEHRRVPTPLESIGTCKFVSLVCCNTVPPLKSDAAEAFAGKHLFYYIVSCCFICILHVNDAAEAFVRDLAVNTCLVLRLATPYKHTLPSPLAGHVLRPQLLAATS